MYETLECLFRSERKAEWIRINEENIEVKTGQIICTILGLDDRFFDKVEKTLEKVRGIRHGYISALEMPVPREEIAKKWLEELKSVLLCEDGLDSEEAILYRLMVFLPCFDAYYNAYAPTMRVLQSESESQEYLSQIRLKYIQPNVDDNKVIQEYERKQKELKKTAREYLKWYDLIQFLESKYNPLIWASFAEKVFDGKNFDSSILPFHDNCFAEMKRIQYDLRGWYLQNNKESYQRLVDSVLGPYVYKANESTNGAGNIEFGNYSINYRITSFSDLVKAEILHLEKIDRTVYECKICGKYFVPFRGSADACMRKNHEYNGKTCSAVFAQKKYRENHKELNAPLWEEFSLNYNAYCKWATENNRFVDEYAKTIYYDETDKGERIISNISNEIKQIQKAWRLRAKNALSAYTSGEIQESMVKELIATPKPAERSPLLAEFRKDVAAFLGK